MNIIKKTLFSLCIFTFFLCFPNATTFAQDTPETETKQQQSQNKGNREAMQAAYNAMLDSLHLTDQQREDIDFVNTKYRAQMQQIRQSNEGDREAMRPKMKELRDKQNEELKEILDEEQFAQYQNWMRENRQRRRGGNQNNNP